MLSKSITNAGQTSFSKTTQAMNYAAIFFYCYNRAVSFINKIYTTVSKAFCLSAHNIYCSGGIHSNKFNRNVRISEPTVLMSISLILHHCISVAWWQDNILLFKNVIKTIWNRLFLAYYQATSSWFEVYLNLWWITKVIWIKSFNWFLIAWP